VNVVLAAALALALGGLVFLAVRRKKALRLLAEEKARSEGLLLRVTSDLEHAARIQRDLLPKSDPRLEGYDIAGVNVPCYEIGGDYYDFIPAGPGRLGIAIADVAGKGIAAALLMASLRAALLAEVRSDCTLDRLAARLSDFVHESSGPSGFVTFFYGDLDLRTGGLRYVNAGHNPPVILDRAGAGRPLGSSGFPLGMFAGAAYEERTASLAPGELMLLFTDGLPEGRNAAGEAYSEARLVALVADSRGSTAEAICARVLGETRDFVCGTQPCDDVTLVVVKRHRGQAGE
jgi:serine phosphatase RsbU (regulator of sigma subunit)